MIVLFTDFGLDGPYTGQMKAVLHQTAPGIPMVDLFADAPVSNPKASAYLLAAYAGWFPAGTVFLCVVDPGVGGARPAIVLEADDRWYVGPGNGLFELVQRRAGQTQSWDIDWTPEHLSASFHGRDLFAPVAGLLARREPPLGQPRQDGADRRADWPDDLGEIVYVDHYGNAMTGVRAAMLSSDARLAAVGRVLERARTFSDLPPGGRSGMRIRTGLPRLPSIRGGRTTRWALRSGPWSRSSLDGSRPSHRSELRCPNLRDSAQDRIGENNNAATSRRRPGTGVWPSRSARSSARTM